MRALAIAVLCVAASASWAQTGKSAADIKATSPDSNSKPDTVGPDPASKPDAELPDSASKPDAATADPASKPDGTLGPDQGQASRPDKKSLPETEFRLAFDKDSAKGEIICKQGKETAGSVIFKECLELNVQAYKDAAVSSGIVDAGKAAGLSAKRAKLAAKLAFLASANRAISLRLSQLQDKKQSFDYKEALGAASWVSSELKASIADCAKDKSGALKCPSFPK